MRIFVLYKTNCNMKNVTLLSLVCLPLFLLSSCFSFGEKISGNGVMETESRKLGKITKIKVAGSVDVEVSPGEPSVKVEADGNLIPYIVTEVEDGVLKVYMKNLINFNTSNNIKVYVTTPLLTSVAVAGSGDVIANGEFDNGDKMSFKIAGSGNITMTVYTPRIDVDIAASGNLNLKGETKDLSVNIAGSGNFEGTDLKAENAKVKIAGSGDVFLFADVKLDAKIVGSGNIQYKGNATVERKIVGSGSISKLP